MAPEVVRQRIEKLDRRFPIIIGVAIALHIVWAFGLIFDPSTQYVTAVHAIMLIAVNEYVAALVFAVSAFLAGVGIVWSRRVWRLSGRVIKTLLFLPQQCLLIMASTGSLEAILTSTTAGGIERPFWFLVVGLCPVLLITIGNVAAVYYFAREVR